MSVVSIVLLELQCFVYCSIPIFMKYRDDLSWSCDRDDSRRALRSTFGDWGQPNISVIVVDPATLINPKKRAASEAEMDFLHHSARLLENDFKKVQPFRFYLDFMCYEFKRLSQSQ